jgi:hypothetical protein
MAHLSNVLKLSQILKPSETYYVENIKSTNFILAQTQNPRIYESQYIGQMSHKIMQSEVEREY